MTISEYCDAINVNIEIIRYSNQNERWTAKFEYCETKDNIDSAILCGEYGEGKTPTEAINSYIRNIRGKRIVLNASSKELRREFIVPFTLELYSKEVI